MNKAANTRRHAEIRAFERYGVACTRELLRSIRKAIRRRMKVTVDTPESAIIKGMFSPRPVLRVNVQETDFFVVWDRAARRIVTFLPPTWDRGYVKKGAA